MLLSPVYNFLILTPIVTTWPPGFWTSPLHTITLKTERQQVGSEDKPFFLFFFLINSKQTPLYITGQNWGHQGGWEGKYLAFFLPLLWDTATPAKKPGKLVWPWGDSQQCLSQGPCSYGHCACLGYFLCSMSYNNMWNSQCHTK